ncbi:MBL fold metallo-hydrolase [Xanthovirga aplysinae]|uniref:MBL fold metallo-hydrolase n=1 Tax=Xanthovirga aplysinae TaxID=2529853 RepID=UPI0012BD16AB|nr:MBL fold metallo-hydrolase [Xanthovirga aplysinae]MTI30823.1 MBL fold metallo-hydrolase [Xanthovirga aplysinae]
MSKKIIILLLTLVVTISAVAIRLSSIKPFRLAYTLPPNDLSGKNWDEILNSTSVIDSFKVLNTGSVKVPLSGMLNTKKLKVGNGLEEYLWVDVFVFLFHHKERGWFMIDTGLDSTFQEEGNIKGLLAGNFILESRQRKGQNIAAQLERENKDIKGVFITHLHGDHTGGLPELNPSIPKYIGKGEQYINIPFLYQSNHLTKKDKLFELDWSKGIYKFPFDHILDIFGDGSFLAIHTPGHSSSHLSYLLMTSEGPVLMTGDASHTKYGFTKNIEPGWVDHQETAEKSLSQLIGFSEMYPWIEIIYGHQR